MSMNQETHIIFLLKNKLLNAESKIFQGSIKSNLSPEYKPLAEKIDRQKLEKRGDNNVTSKNTQDCKKPNLHFNAQL
jgi:hypothetical protein